MPQPPYPEDAALDIVLPLLPPEEPEDGPPRTHFDYQCEMVEALARYAEPSRQPDGRVRCPLCGRGAQHWRRTFDGCLSLENHLLGERRHLRCSVFADLIGVVARRVFEHARDYYGDLGYRELLFRMAAEDRASGA